MDPQQRYTTEQVLKHSWITHRDQLPNDQPNRNDTSQAVKVKQTYFCAPSKCLIPNNAIACHSLMTHIITIKYLYF